MVALAAAATVIASQAVISGTFSLTAQLIHLGQLPRTNIVQTSRAEQGQIYIPLTNWMLALATIALVVGFRSSSALASAYGIAVATTMVITSVLAFFVAVRYGWNEWLTALLLGPFLLLDLLFFGVNLLKIADGGWYPIVVAILAYIIMRAWARGRELLMRRWGHEAKPPQVLAQMLADGPLVRIPGVAVLLTPSGQIPPHFFRHLERHRVLQEKVILVSVQTEDEPRIPATERLTLIGIAPDITHIVMRYGFMQVPNVPVALRFCERLGFEIDLENITYYVGRETVLPSAEIEGMALWREHLFAFLSRNAMRATAFYGLPPDDVVELGFHVEI
jgi:KUP system potassium uptake protein